MGWQAARDRQTGIVPGDAYFASYPASLGLVTRSAFVFTEEADSRVVGELFHNSVVSTCDVTRPESAFLGCVQSATRAGFISKARAVPIHLHTRRPDQEAVRARAHCA